ncbi:hypothetical protein AK812_SmicGene26874 [Symbiodinium microadriaticum]|uniref:Uncharacterized protein n=1 Tax=Symbiodinium microadriaticum TaxID=2951 RepID=A0A1Q9D8F5_SYMMI|nr:hypothetical protein AK812_SmicGene26874 [Symbiodinium microadriaticum]
MYSGIGEAAEIEKVIERGVCFVTAAPGKGAWGAAGCAHKVRSEVDLAFVQRSPEEALSVPKAVTEFGKAEDFTLDNTDGTKGCPGRVEDSGVLRVPVISALSKTHAGAIVKRAQLHTGCSEHAATWVGPLTVFGLERMATGVNARDKSAMVLSLAKRSVNDCEENDWSTKAMVKTHEPAAHVNAGTIRRRAAINNKNDIVLRLPRHRGQRSNNVQDPGILSSSDIEKTQTIAGNRRTGTIHGGERRNHTARLLRVTGVGKPQEQNQSAEKNWDLADADRLSKSGT